MLNQQECLEKYTAKTIPKAHKYCIKKPKASHWGPSQKSGSSPGSAGKTYPSSTVARVPVSSGSLTPVAIWSVRSSSSSLVDDDDEPLLLFLLPNFLVVEESFLAAETMWEVLQGFDGKRVGRWRGRWVYGVVVGVLQRIRVLWRAISVELDWLKREPLLGLEDRRNDKSCLWNWISTRCWTINH